MTANNAGAAPVARPSAGKNSSTVGASTGIASATPSAGAR